jgi:hypothetical protein
VRTLSRREKALAALVALAAVLVAVQRLRNPAETPAARARAEPLPPPVPRIDLARLTTELPETTAGKRDLFRFGAAVRDSDLAELPPVETQRPVPLPTPAIDTAYVPPAPPSLPPLNLKYLGSVENRAGVKVAVLMTERREVLTGQAGDMVANRYRIARIGLESVDLEDVGSGQSRRIPLRGN